MQEVCSCDDLGELEDMERVVQVQFDSCGRALEYYEYHRKHFAAVGDLLHMLDNVLPPAELQKRRESAQFLLQGEQGSGSDDCALRLTDDKPDQRLASNHCYFAFHHLAFGRRQVADATRLDNTFTLHLDVAFSTQGPQRSLIASRS